MRVGMLSYPMLFQREGGLQVQVRATMRALQERSAPGLEVALVDANRERLDQFDLIHVFSAINGNHRLVELAVELGVPVVLSSVLSPGWGRLDGMRARLADRLTGRLTGWNVQTSYAQTKCALQLAHMVIALGAAERDAIVSAFQIAEAKIRVLPNGISPHFFGARQEEFRRCTGLCGPFVLMVGAISPYKNQLGLVRALASTALPVVLIGRAQRQHQNYLQQLLAQPRVRWLGQLEHDDPLLASAYASASVLALPSQGEVFPLSVLEALAAGTPVVMTDESALSLPDSAFAVKQLPWDDTAGLRLAVEGLLAHPPDRAQVRALVERFSWQRVAEQMVACYTELYHRTRREQEARRAV
ncbi:glycosyltransferase family 4 protein [Duganella violaceipulchra]|uniref:Glycosyltransferase involved in cell wall biosynthesis n=2 Tax=Duganella violaceipulchra TaxID=2849652 RepID=A0ABT1GDV2_9BURK|nr:glycosyltransferase family 4 protein [Duganella violaceicalia]MCP2007143.1 glycosyltransferase involved in cell wall biosynthesis [Duganella violaceicalia]